MRILIVDDEINLSSALAEVFKRNGYDVECAYEGKTGLHLALSGVFDVILLDIMLPKLTGFEILKKLRKKDKETPVILLSARTGVSDKVTGLDYGADDYLPKPFNTDELLARIRSAARRKKGGDENERITLGDTTLYPEIKKMTTQTREVILSERESKMAVYFFRNETVIMPYENIIEKVWDDASDGETATLDSVHKYVGFIRKKLEFIGSGLRILEIKELGYKLLA